MNACRCLFLLLAVTFSCLAGDPPFPELIAKKWHSSFPRDKPTSKFFQVIDWKLVPKVNIGLSIADLKSLGIVMLEPYGNADALIYSVNPEGTNYEIELKISPEKTISDISYKAAPPIASDSSSLYKAPLKVPPKLELTPPPPNL